MLGLNFSEIMVIVFVLIIVVGPERMPPLLRQVGRYYGQIKRMSDEFRRAIMLEVDREEAEERAAQFKKRREDAKRIADEARAVKQAADAVAPFQAPQTESDPDVFPKEEEAS